MSILLLLLIKFVILPFFLIIVPIVAICVFVLSQCEYQDLSEKKEGGNRDSNS